MKNILFLLLASLFFLTCDSCKKSDPFDQLPDAHNTDAESVFGCLVNGEVWKPSTGFNKIVYSYHEATGGFTIEAIQKKISENINQSFRCNNHFFDTGVFDFDLNEPYVDYFFCEDNTEEYYLDTLSPHFFKVEELSKDKGIIIGTFEFTAISDDLCQNQLDTLHVTDGRFKATYK